MCLDPKEPAFAHGYGVFETMRVAGGKLYFWAAHWSRLEASCRALGLPLRVDATSLFQAIQRLVGDSMEARTVKVSVLGEGAQTRIFVYSRPAYAISPPVGLLLGCDAPINEHSLLAGQKTHNYMENRILMDRAKASNCYDVLRVNTSGFVVEGASSNVFWEKAGVVYTPSLETGLLPGVVRSVLLNAHEVRTGAFPLDAILDAEAVFLTNSHIGVLPVEYFREASGRQTPLASADSQVVVALGSIFHRISESQAQRM